MRWESIWEIRNRVPLSKGICLDEVTDIWSHLHNSKTTSSPPFIGQDTKEKNIQEI
jgi:hypothetical protein